MKRVGCQCVLYGVMNGVNFPGLYGQRYCGGGLALEEANNYGSLLAKYMLGYSLRHGDVRCRNEVRGNALLKETMEVRHFSADKARGPVSMVDGVSMYPAGTLANLELLIDVEVGAIELSNLEVELMATTKRYDLSTEDFRDKLERILDENNPFTERSARRISDWLEDECDEPPDEVKLAVMQKLCIQDGDSSTSGDKDE